MGVGMGMGMSASNVGCCGSLKVGRLHGDKLQGLSPEPYIDGGPWGVLRGGPKFCL